VSIPQHWRNTQASPTIHFLRQYHVDEFLHSLSYKELLGFLPDDPKSDSYIFAVREVNAFRLLCEDPAVFFNADDVLFDSQADMIGGDSTSRPTTSGPSSNWELNLTANHADSTSGPTTSGPATSGRSSDWELNLTANHAATATANWASTKHQYTNEDLERMRPWLAWFPIANIRKTLENITQMAKAASSYPMIRHLTSRFRLLNRFRLQEIVSTDTIFSSVAAVGEAQCAQVFYGLTSHHMDVYGMESKNQFPDVYKEFIRDQGLPSGLHRDNEAEQKSRKISQLNLDYGVKESFVEAGNPNQNPVEAQAIKLIKKTADGSYEYIASYVVSVRGNFHQIEDPAKGIRTALSAHTCIQNSIDKFERMFGGDIKESRFPMHEGSHPESDTSDLVTSEMATQYRAIIGSLNWVVILGRFDIMYATNTLARFSMAPRIGHLESAKRILGYLKKYPEHRILLNPNPIDLTKAVEKYDGWREFYPEAQEDLPTGMPTPMAQITIVVDADHAHCEVTRRMVGWLDGWIFGSMDLWIYGSMHLWIFGWTDLWTDGSVDGWMDGWMDRWIDG
jgi:hypothetical protein